MSVIQPEVSIAANSTNANIISGSAFEFAKQRQMVSIGLAAAATGLQAFISSGSDLILEESPPQILTRFPIIPDEFYYNDVMEVMDRLVIRVRNTTAGAIIMRAVIQIQPL